MKGKPAMALMNAKTKSANKDIHQVGDIWKKIKVAEKYAYIHREQSDAQKKLNETMAWALTTQINETAYLINEVNKIK